MCLCVMCVYMCVSVHISGMLKKYENDTEYQCCLSDSIYLYLMSPHYACRMIGN